eukprot:scaffold795_cov187-Amphora_coffeaeformis.AAC.31
MILLRLSWVLFWGDMLHHFSGGNADNNVIAYDIGEDASESSKHKGAKPLRIPWIRTQDGPSSACCRQRGIFGLKGSERSRSIPCNGDAIA